MSFTDLVLFWASGIYPFFEVDPQPQKKSARSPPDFLGQANYQQILKSKFPCPNSLRASLFRDIPRLAYGGNSSQVLC